MTTPRHFLGIVKTDGQTTITPTLSGHDEEEVEGRLSSSLSCDRHLAVEQSARTGESPILSLVHLVIVLPFPLSSSSGFDIRHRRTTTTDKKIRSLQNITWRRRGWDEGWAGGAHETEKLKLGIDLLSLFEESETILTRRGGGRKID